MTEAKQPRRLVESEVGQAASSSLGGSLADDAKVSLQKLCEKGLQHLLLQQNDAGKKLLAQAASKNFLFADLFLLLLGEALQGGLEAVRLHYQKIVSGLHDLSLLEPEKDPFLWYFLGELSLRFKQQDSSLKPAIECFENAVAYGHRGGGGLVRLGEIYLAGIPGVPQDIRRASKYIKQAAAQGCAKAQWFLGESYMGLNALCAKGGVPQDDRRGIEWIRQAAEQGHVGAQMRLGWHYLNGEIVQKNEQLAARYFEAAAVQGNSGAQAYIGRCYLYGIGVTGNWQKGRVYFERAAEQGDKNSQEVLAFFGKTAWDAYREGGRSSLLAPRFIRTEERNSDYSKPDIVQLIITLIENRETNAVNAILTHSSDDVLMSIIKEIADTRDFEKFSRLFSYPKLITALYSERSINDLIRQRLTPQLVMLHERVRVGTDTSISDKVKEQPTIKKEFEDLCRTKPERKHVILQKYVQQNNLFVLQYLFNRDSSQILEIIGMWFGAGNRNLLHIAAEHDSLRAAEFISDYLITVGFGAEKFANCARKVNEHKKTPLALAVEKGHSETAAFFALKTIPWRCEELVTPPKKNFWSREASVTHQTKEQWVTKLKTCVAIEDLLKVIHGIPEALTALTERVKPFEKLCEIIILMNQGGEPTPRDVELALTGTGNVAKLFPPSVAVTSPAAQTSSSSAAAASVMGSRSSLAEPPPYSLAGMLSSFGARPKPSSLGSGVNIKGATIPLLQGKVSSIASTYGSGSSED